MHFPTARRRCSCISSLLLAVLLSGCTPLFFHPQSALLDAPDQHGIEYRVEHLRAADGTGLTAWFMPASHRENGRPSATVLFLHGNAENISTHFRSVAWLAAEGFNVLALDYRGYGSSEGVPSLAGMQLDIDAAMLFLLEQPDLDPGRIVLYGQSLGGALAIHYAARGPHRAGIRTLVVDSSFSDYREIAREKLAAAWLTWPLQWLAWLTIDNDYSPATSVATLSPLPLLLIHGDRDLVVPYRNSQRLFELAGQPKQLWIVPGAGHTQALSSDAVRRRLTAYLLQQTKDDPQR